MEPPLRADNPEVTKLRRKDGTLIPVEATSSMITVGGRKVLQAFIRDISERRKIELERESLIAELKRTLNELKTLRSLKYPIKSVDDGFSPSARGTIFTTADLRRLSISPEFPGRE